jgi:hypothetical protein
MIDIAILYKKDYTAFTLASLLDKSEEFRVHLYFKWGEWDDVLVDWAVENFRNIQCYQLPGISNNISKMILHMRRWYMDKPESQRPSKRLMVITGNNIFHPGKLVSGHIPPESYFDNKVGILNRKLMYRQHPAYKNYYNILKINHKVPQGKNITDAQWESVAFKQYDWDMFMVNYDALMKIRDGNLFFKGGTHFATRFKGEPQIDAYLNNCSNVVFFRALMKLKPVDMPLYMDGRLDKLIKLDAIGPKDCINHNIMLRKSYSINIDHSTLMSDYYSLPTGIQLATPFELYGNLIDKIPLNLRNARLNEQILLKSEKQKITTRKLVQAGYKLGKID